MSKGMEMKRNHTIDLLRVIGLILVISAHCGFSPWFTNIRDFDVILLMFVSGISFAVTYRKNDHYGNYARKRFFRLIVPVWIFLVLFFVFFGLLGRFFTLSVIAQSFLLLSGGILFVWVYRVFFTSSLLNPFLDRLEKRFSRTSILILPAVLVINDLLSMFLFAKLGTVGKVLQHLITYTSAYGMVSFAGIVFWRSAEKERLLLGLEGLVLFLVSGVILKFPDFYSAKYPPTVYYCGYGLCWSVLLYELFSRLPLKGEQPLLTWLSVHTMDIFMWHIFAFYLLDTLNPELLEKPWYDFTVFLGIGIAGAFLQEKCMKAWERRRK